MLGAGFTLLPTNTSLPDGTRYPYRSSVDYIAPFVAAMSKAGIGHGFYYNFGDNYFLNKRSCTGSTNTNRCDEYCGPTAAEWMGSTCLQLLPRQQNISYAEYERLVVAQVSELWSRYGNLTEIWCAPSMAHNVIHDCIIIIVVRERLILYGCLVQV